MNRIDSRTVELTLRERAVKAQMEFDLDGGASIVEASTAALEWAVSQGYPLSAEFVEYLSEDCLMVTHPLGAGPRSTRRKIIATPKGRALLIPPPCSHCGWQYPQETLNAAARGEVALDFNPTHLCAR